MQAISYHFFWQFANTYNDLYCNEVHFNTQDNMNFVIKVRKLNNMFTVCYFKEKNYLYLVFYMRKKITEMVIKQSTLYIIVIVGNSNCQVR